MSDLLAKSMRLAPYALAVFGVVSMLMNAATSIAMGGPF